MPLNGSIDFTARKAPSMNSPSTDPAFELRFRSLSNEGRGYAFPCDAKGNVDMDSLTERTRNNYMFARSVIGRDLAAPVIRPNCLH